MLITSWSRKQWTILEAKNGVYNEDAHGKVQLSPENTEVKVEEDAEELYN